MEGKGDLDEIEVSRGTNFRPNGFRNKSSIRFLLGRVPNNQTFVYELAVSTEEVEISSASVEVRRYSPADRFDVSLR